MPSNAPAHEALAHLALRIGLAFAFVYPAVAEIGDPVSWESYFPSFIHALPVSPLILLHAFGALEVTIALWVLSGWRIRLPAALAAVLLITIVAFNVSQLDVLFRDLAIAAMAVALALWPSPQDGTRSVPGGTS